MGDVRQPPGAGGNANPGWYADPWGQSAWRWWDGWQWTGWVSPADATPAHLMNQAVARSVPQSSQSPAPVEPPAWARQPPRTQPETQAMQSVPPQTGLAWVPVAPPMAPASIDRPPAAPPAPPVPRNERRRLVAELLLVLAVFPLPYTVSAIVDLVSDLLGNGPGQRTPVLIRGHAAASFPFELVLILLPLAAAGLAAYLLSVPGPLGSDWQERRGEGGLRALGLDRTNWRGDVALVFGVFILCFALPIYGGGLLLHALGVHAVTPGTGSAPKYFFVLNVANGITSGIVEEVVVLGFLVRRLEQLNLPAWTVVLIGVAVRGSYHLYYGWGVLPILVWATVSIVVYRRYRRLAPFLIVHILWDSSLFLASTMSVHRAGYFLFAEAGILLPLTFVLFLVWRLRIPRPIAARR